MVLRMIARGGNIDKYPAKAHARRVAQNLHESKGIIVVSAAQLVPWPNSDMPAPFRQDRYFYYLTGCNEPGCRVTYELETDILTLWLPAIDKSRVIWTGRGSTVEEALAKYDIDEGRYLPAHTSTLPLQEGTDVILSSLKGELEQNWPHSVFHIIANAAKLDLLFSSTPDDVVLASGIRSSKGTKARQLQWAIDSCRVIKDEHEINLIRQANRISARAHEAVLKHIHHLSNEAEAEAEYMRVCIAHHAKEQAYNPIFGSGVNAAELHYVNNDQDFSHRQMIVIDAGCEVHCYASDVTRTLPLNRSNPGHWPSKEAEQIYNLVAKVQEACIAQMIPGNSFYRVAWLATEMTMAGLLELGILKGDKDEVRKAGTWRGFFPHGLGHHVGLEVHDVPPRPPPKDSKDIVAGDGQPFQEPLPPTWRALDWYNTPQPHNIDPETMKDYTILRPGMIITIEPGVYFNSFLLENFFLNDPAQRQFIDQDVLKRFMPVGGVRIEDDMLITKDGHENLTLAPKGEAMLECIRRGAEEGRRAGRDQVSREARP
ncbi:hypothetical protein LTR62_008015 [Meristemomyces frigidus]|uniref:Xaa-Pro aminopeptidase n=1 Tax=Meristemomyces frigidus TaxID=1508187 RepID=A0AAN7TI50_9PEZI|nr:hypothetical protein LTR62_008015 [Meristemomyces frigidus]